MHNDLYQVTVNGCELRYLRTGTGTPVVFLHPLRAQLEYFLPLLRHLDPARFEVIALDSPTTTAARMPVASRNPATASVK